MADNEDTVTPEAYQRVIKERDELRKQNGELGSVVKDYGLREKAIDHLRGKGVPDPTKWATVALPHLRDVEDIEQVATKVDELFGDSLPVQQQTQPPAAPQEAPAEDTPPPPSPFTPNPAGGGTVPSNEALKPGSEEWKQVLKDEGIDGLRRLDQEGRVAWTSENLRWQGHTNDRR